MSITNRIHFRNVQGDVLGGLTAAVVALPMALDSANGRVLLFHLMGNR